MNDTTAAPAATAAVDPLAPASWMSDSQVLDRLRQAVQVLLDCLDTVLEDFELQPLGEAICGGGEFACQHSDLPEGFAPLVEAEAARLLVEHATMRRISVFDAALPEQLNHLGALDVEDQQSLTRATAAAYHRAHAGEGSRRDAALARSPQPAPPPAAPTTIVVPASAVFAAQYLRRRR
jgi:hypothetical protein